MKNTYLKTVPSLLTFISFPFVGMLLSSGYAHANVNEGDQYQTSAATITVSSVTKTCATAQSDGPVLIDARFELGDEVAAISCSMKSGIEGFLQATEITAEIATVGAACSVGGAPVTVVTGITGILTQMISLVVSNMDCEDPTSDRKIEIQVKKNVCEALVRQGIACNPSTL